MASKDVHTRITELEARIAKLEILKHKAQTLKSDVKRNKDQRKARSIADSLKS